MSSYNCIYTTQGGESLASIATQYGVSTQLLANANSQLGYSYTFVSLLPAMIRVKVPCEVDIHPMIPITACTYIYQTGDSLDTVATVLNTQASNLIYYGDGVGPTIGAVVTASGCYNNANGLYITRQGDTFQDIATRFSVSVEDIISHNNIAGDTNQILPPGQALIIPSSSSPSPPLM